MQTIVSELAYLKQAVQGYDVPSGVSIVGMMYKHYEMEGERLGKWNQLMDRMAEVVADLRFHNSEQYNRLSEENRRLNDLVQKLTAERQLWLSHRELT